MRVCYQGDAQRGIDDLQPASVRDATTSLNWSRSIGPDVTDIESSKADSPAVLVLTTLGSDTDASSIARTLVEERLAACVNVLPVTSVYRWQGSVQQDREQQLVIKTTLERVPALEARLRELHPYELPEFLVIRAADGSDAYLAWIGECVSASRSS